MSYDGIQKFNLYSMKVHVDITEHSIEHFLT